MAQYRYYCKTVPYGHIAHSFFITRLDKNGTLPKIFSATPSISFVVGGFSSYICFGHGIHFMSIFQSHSIDFVFAVCIKFVSALCLIKYSY